MASTHTMQNLCDAARLLLNDSAKTRYPDAALLEYGNNAIRVLRNKAPHLFVGSFAALPGDKVIGDTFPLEDEYYPAVTDYVIARASTVDGQHIVEGRAELFFKLFSSQV